jgi:hypothetical protein
LEWDIFKVPTLIVHGINNKTVRIDAATLAGSSASPCAFFEPANQGRP